MRWEHTYNRFASQESALVFESNNRPVYHHERAVLSSAFKYKLLRNVLHYSLVPSMAFAKVQHFHPAFGFAVQMDVIF
jgi:hypothetical protein